MQSKTLRNFLYLLPCLWYSGLVLAQSPQSGASSDGAEEEIVEYSSSFYSRYSPNTAYDMILQTPGFQLDDGGDQRGLGASAGNVLINDRRPSAKQDLPSVILTRIPASLVDKIELIRGQVRDIDLQGQSVVANIILKEDSEAAISWDVTWRYNLDFKSTYEGGISISDNWNGIDYNAGLEMRYFTRGDITLQDTFDGDDVLEEKRIEEYFLNGIRGAANLNLSTAMGENLVKFNTTISWQDQDALRQKQEIDQPPSGAFRREFIGGDEKLRSIEVGTDIERYLLPDLQATLIGLFIRSREDNFGSLRRALNIGPTTFLRQADEDLKSTEGIVRLEFDWTGISSHTIQANLEGAINVLDGGLFQTEDTGAGDEVVSVPGANSRVKETRGDFLLKDTWTLGSIELDYGMGAEVSTISQSGDAVLERSFTFLKPQAVLSHNSGQGQQTRLSVFRDVAQLDFGDFISGNVFEDDDVALGNPNLKPDTTWVTQVSHERRFGPESILKITVFHHWISDAIDLLPLSETFEATGNIGDGRRWGATIETTIPLEWLGLTGARLNIFGRWQDSSVTDPVTGEKRVLSDRTPPARVMPLMFSTENKYAFSIDYRQDFQEQKVSWGWDIRERGKHPRFRANELDILNEDIEINSFIETTRWFGLKLRFDAENILDLTSTRDRIRYTGARDLTSVRFREEQIRKRSFRLAFSVSGSF